MAEHEIFRGIIEKNIDNANVILTGIPFDKNASIGLGASLAPDHIRELSKMVPATSKDGFKIEGIRMFDNGNITDEDFDLMQKKAFNALNTGKFNLFLGGDHSVAIATERAFYDYAKSINKNPVIIHLDAHPDICDIYEDNYYSHACPNRRSLDYGYKDKDLFIIGVRGFEEQEIDFFEKHPEIYVFNASNTRKLGAENLINLLVAKYGDSNNLIYLSYDIDINDPAFAPGTGTPEPFGLDNNLVMEIIEGIFKNLNVRAFDIVEVAPPLDINDITSYLAIKAIYEALYILSLKK